MFDRILIANRGEIACRIMATCKRMGVSTVAVHSSADRRALHVEMADAAVRIGAAPSAASYLNIEAVIGAARTTGAEAIHPGYGFLSENAAFAEACADAGIVFVGPPPAAIRAMGSKAEAKRIMAAAGVAVVPGDAGAGQDDSSLADAASAAGYPVIVKPSLGGGGRGMRVVRSPAALSDAIASARREARSSFGDDALLIEKYVENPRHIEVQVFADGHGNVVHLFERDCSVQRRHQKVIEEAPAPGLDGGLRDRLGAAAVAAAGAVGYVGAGTVEFLLLPDGEFYFIEMNTRLQVEHPVTEMITGLDLVEWQLRVAAGEALPLRQPAISATGHAIEARLYAEDPENEFRPGFGRLDFLDLSDGGDGVRIDSGVRTGDEVTVHYDPMIAKLVAHGPDRDSARTRLSAALGAVRIVGPATNERFLKAIVDHPVFGRGGVDTGFIAAHAEDLVPPSSPAPDVIRRLAALAVLTARAAAGPRSPWADTAGWRAGGGTRRRIAVTGPDGEQVHTLYPDGRLDDGRETVTAAGAWRSDTAFAAEIDGESIEATVVRAGSRIVVFADGARYEIRIVDPLAAGGRRTGDAGSLYAQMPGVVVACPVLAGDRVVAGATLIVIEAMKVEHTIRAPADGTVTELPYAVGDRVAEGTELVRFTPD